VLCRHAPHDFVRVPAEAFEAAGQEESGVDGDFQK
jgi:hypothetical protein